MLGEIDAKAEVVARGTFHTSSSAAAAAADIGLCGGDEALAAESPKRRALGPGHPKLRCFALGSLMGMWCL